MIRITFLVTAPDHSLALLQWLFKNIRFDFICDVSINDEQHWQIHHSVILLWCHMSQVQSFKINISNDDNEMHYNISTSSWLGLHIDVLVQERHNSSV